jgi:hypothetical protein
MPKIKLENLKFEKIMSDYATILEKTIPDAVHLGARLVCVEFARRTQPFGWDKKVGEKAISKDIFGGRRSSGKGKGRYGLFAPISGFMAANAEEYSSGNIRLFVKKDKTVYGTDRAHFLPGAGTSDIASIHKSNFVNGRMSAAGGDTRNIGRWKFIDKYYVPKSSLDAFVTAQFAKVGLAKSGWVECADRLKKVVSNPFQGIPKWVQELTANYDFGRVEDRTSNTSAPTVVLTNTCRYADKVLRETEKLQGLSIVAGNMKKQMERILKHRKLKLQEAA